jgi:phospholipid/cholesterol/gamma-HCH transport system permease protein
VIGSALAQCRRALVEAGPAVVGAAALASFAGLTRGEAGTASAAIPWPREAAPLVAALVACGPLAAARAGELARLRVDHQVDALRVMGGSVWRHLVAPRLLAAGLALPLLVLLADAAGLAVAYLDWAPRAARLVSADGVAPRDVVLGLARGVLFGGALAAVGCAAGLRGESPPGSVPRAAARAGAGGAVAVLGLHVALGGGLSW